MEVIAPWQLIPAPPTPPEVWAEVLDGGQSFRWNRQPNGSWRGIWLQHVVELRTEASGGLLWRTQTPTTTTADVAAYLALDVDFAALTDALPWRSDAVFAAAIKPWPGLRLLRQPLGEVLLGFICSATKRIPQIKQGLAEIARRFGPALTDHDYALPTWEALAAIPEADLRATGIGYRARHIADAARFLAARPGYLEALPTLPTPEARAALIELPGVGPKVADCVLLFGLQRLEAFPVDTWIIQTMARHYGLDGWEPERIAHFGRVHFGPHAGLAQQFLFAGARRG